MAPELTAANAPRAFAVSLATTLGTIAALPVPQQLALLRSLMSHVAAAKSLDGLESVYLTAMNAAGASGALEQLADARSLWRVIGPPDTNGGRLKFVPFFDVSTGQLTFLDQEGVNSLFPGGANAGVLDNPGHLLAEGIRAIDPVGDPALMHGEDDGGVNRFCKYMGDGANAATAAAGSAIGIAMSGGDPVDAMVGGVIGAAAGGAAGSAAKDAAEDVCQWTTDATAEAVGGAIRDFMWGLFEDLWPTWEEEGEEGDGNGDSAPSEEDTYPNPEDSGLTYFDINGAKRILGAAPRDPSGAEAEPTTPAEPPPDPLEELIIPLDVDSEEPEPSRIVGAPPPKDPPKPIGGGTSISVAMGVDSAEGIRVTTIGPSTVLVNGLPRLSSDGRLANAGMLALIPQRLGLRTDIDLNRVVPSARRTRNRIPDS